MISKNRRLSSNRNIITANFPGVLEDLRRHPLGANFHIVQAGWFPSASGHFKNRPNGAKESILIVCLRGSGWFTFAGRKHAVSRGLAFILPANVRHSYGADEADPWSICWAHFSGTNSGIYHSILPDKRPMTELSETAIGEARLWFRKIFSQLAAGPGLHEALLASHSLRFLLGACIFGNQGLAESRQGLDRSSIERVINLLHSRTDRNISLNEMAKLAYLSPSRFSAIFRAKTGIPPVEYHIRLRMRKACALLDTTPRAIKDIAGSLGYEDPYYFSRLFRRVVGLSPVAYRNSPKA